MKRIERFHSPPFPSHNTHTQQTSDLLVFKSLKSDFSKAVDEKGLRHLKLFARTVKTPFERAFSMSTLVEAENTFSAPLKIMYRKTQKLFDMFLLCGYSEEF